MPGLYRDAISSIESGGRYNLQGPVTKSGDRAYGRYQVMGSNIGPWTKEALGRELTPAQFLADSDAQDQTFDHRFGKYVQSYGPEGASKAWFAGEKGMNNPNARDQLGTSVASYGSRFSKYINGQGGSGIADVQNSYKGDGGMPTQERTAPPLNLSAFDPQAGGMDAMAQYRGGDGNGLENGLNKAAVSLMSVYNPAGANAMNAANKEQWSTVTGKDGRLYKINRMTGEVVPVDGADGPVGKWHATVNPLNGQTSYYNDTTMETRGTPPPGGDGIAYPQTKSDLKRDDDYVKQHNEFTTNGAANTAASLTDIDKSIAILQANKGKTLGVTGKIMGLAAGTKAEPFVNADGIAAKEAAARAVQSGLKAILADPNPNAQQVASAYSRYYNPSLGEDENIKRLTDLRTKIVNQHAARKEMADYYNTHHGLTGYKGKPLATLDSLLADDPASGSPNAAALKKQYGLE